MTPWASSGQSARSSSRIALSRRSASVGSTAVTDAVRGCGNEGGELADRGSRAELHERLVATVNADEPLDDREEVRLDGPFLDQHLARQGANLVRGLGDGGEDAPWNAGEQIDAMQSGDPLDEAKGAPLRRRHRANGCTWRSAAANSSRRIGFAT